MHRSGNMCEGAREYSSSSVSSSSSISTGSCSLDKLHSFSVSIGEWTVFHNAEMRGDQEKRKEWKSEENLSHKNLSSLVLSEFAAPIEHIPRIAPQAQIFRPNIYIELVLSLREKGKGWETKRARVWSSRENVGVTLKDQHVPTTRVCRESPVGGIWKEVLLNEKYPVPGSWSAV